MCMYKSIEASFLMYVWRKYHICEDVLVKCTSSPTSAYLPLQHGDFIREEVDNVLLPKGLGQEVAHGGAHSREHTGKQQTFIWAKYRSS